MRELTGAIASGDTEAFGRFYRDWFNRAFRYARLATGRDEAFCLDVVQDAMLRVIRSMRAMNTEQEVSNWLRAVVKSCAYDRLRKDRRRMMRESRAADKSECDAATAGRLAWLESELSQLDARTFPLLVLRFRFGWTLQQIGRVLGIKPGAVDGRIRRATEELRKSWNESDHG